jgi:fructokinase
MTTGTGSGRAHPDVVVVGESLIDIIATAAGPVEFAGGSGLNVAFGVGRLGVNTGLLTVLGPTSGGKQSAGTWSPQASSCCQGPSAWTGPPRQWRLWTVQARRITSSTSSDPAPATRTFMPQVLHTGSWYLPEPGATTSVIS